MMGNKKSEKNRVIRLLQVITVSMVVRSFANCNCFSDNKGHTRALCSGTVLKGDVIDGLDIAS